MCQMCIIIEVSLRYHIMSYHTWIT